MPSRQLVSVLLPVMREAFDWVRVPEQAAGAPTRLPAVAPVPPPPLLALLEERGRLAARPLLSPGR